MTLWRMTPLRLDIPPGLNETGGKGRDNRLAYRRCRRERRHGPNGRSKKLNLPIFRDSSLDNDITYDDWCSEVDNYVREGHSQQLIRDSVLSALEGRPRHTAKAAMVDGDGSLKSIMSALDQVYGGATTYTTLLNKLNSVQQGYAEPAKDYYERVLQIRCETAGVSCLYVSSRRSGMPDEGSLL